MKTLLAYLHAIFIAVGITVFIASTIILIIGAKLMSDGIGMTASIKSLFQ